MGMITEGPYDDETCEWNLRYEWKSINEVKSLIIQAFSLGFGVQEYDMWVLKDIDTYL